MEILLIRIGGRRFGVPLAHVRYVAPMPSAFVSCGEGREDYFVFEGEPLTYVSLWDLLRLQSEYAEYEEMQAMLPQRRQDHLDWMSALEDSLRNGTTFAKARNPRECAFGRWYYSHHSRDRRLSLLMGQFEAPHAAIHNLADRLLGTAESGQGNAALAAFEEAQNTTLATLMRLFDSAIALVEELQRRIAVIIADGDNTCALGADGVLDIVDIPPERFKHDVNVTRATAGLAILEDQTVVPMLNWQAFSHSGKTLPLPA